MAIFAAKFELVPPGIHRSIYGSLGDWSNTGVLNSTELDQISQNLESVLSYHSVKTVKPVVDTLAYVPAKIKFVADMLSEYKRTKELGNV